MDSNRVCVVGAIEGALALAADLALAGNAVAIWDDTAYGEALAPIQDNGNRMGVTGVARQGTATFRCITTDLAEALEDAGTVYITLWPSQILPFAEKLIPLVQPGMRVYICSGSGTGSTLALAKVLRDAGKLEGVLLGEFCTMPYGAIRRDPQSLEIDYAVGFNLFAALPAHKTPEQLPEIQEQFPSILPAADILECSLHNGNIMCHGPILVYNASTVERGGNYHYRDGLTPSVARAVDAMDRERLSLCRSMGYREVGLADSMVRKGYFPKLWPDTYETFRRSGFMDSQGPDTLDQRYMTEDVPYSASLVPILGKILGTPTPLFDSMIALCGALMGRNYHQEGWTTENLGLKGLDAGTLRDLLQHGDMRAFPADAAG